MPDRRHDLAEHYCNRCLDLRPGLLDLTTGRWSCECGWTVDINQEWT